MKLKLLFVVGLAVGYLLGARAGRGKYEQLKEKATEAWEDPRVQRVVTDAQGFVKENAPLVQEKVVAGTKSAVSGVHDGYLRAADSAKEVTTRVADTAKDVTEKVVGSAQEFRERVTDRSEEVVDGVFVSIARARDSALEDESDDDAEQGSASS